MCQRRKDYGLEVLSKTPGLYQVPKLKILNFCFCTVYFRGGGIICEKGLGGQSWEDYGFYILAKPPGLYQVPKLRNFNFCFCTVCFQGGSRMCEGGLGGSDGILEMKRLWA